MFIQIKNEPRNYAWGSESALSELLGTIPSGNPEAELWLGSHPSSPAQLTRGTSGAKTLIDLIESDPVNYGVEGKLLPFLMKVLAIDAPLSLQAHPTLEVARAGFAAEEAARVPRDARHRNYRDSNHKPELLVALTEVQALSGFRSIDAAAHDIRVLVDKLGDSLASDSLRDARSKLLEEDGGGYESFLRWAINGGEPAKSALASLRELVLRELIPHELGQLRLEAMQRISTHFPNDPGLLVSLLLNVVQLEPGEAIYLDAGNIHAYLSGTAIEVMASSDNVMRGGMTAKHVDINELCRVVNFSELEEPKLSHREVAPGLIRWEPDIPDFCLWRADLTGDLEGVNGVISSDNQLAGEVELDAHAPLTMIVTKGRVRIDRMSDGIESVAHLRRGQALYVSSGEPIRIQGNGQVYAATVGSLWQ